MVQAVIVSDIEKVEGRHFPAGRRSVNLVGGRSPIQAENFCMGQVSVEPYGQVPWHNHIQEEIYYILEGKGEMCVAEEMQTITAGQVVYIPSLSFHQLTNTGAGPLVFIYCYGPIGDVAHWRQELDGTLPRAGQTAPSLPPGALPQQIEGRGPREKGSI